MNQHSKRAIGITALISLFTLGATAILPASSAALTTAQTTSAFCSALPTKANTIASSITNLSGKVTQAWSQQSQKLSADEQKVDQDVATDRANADSARNAEFAKLQAKATTDAEKQAVGTYMAAVTNAVTARRNAYDAARQAFRTGVQNAISTRHTTVSSQLTAFQNSVSSALSTAAAACTSTPQEGSSIRTTLVASLKTARTTFQGDRQSDDKVGAQIQQLAATRNAAFKAADQAFAASIATARAALKQAFAVSGTSV